MLLVAALSAGIFFYLLVGFVTGYGPRVSWPGRTRPILSERQLWLLQAGLKVTPRQFWTACALIGALAFALVAAVTGTPAVAIAPGLTVAAVPRAYFAKQRAQRLRQMQEQWPDGIRDLIASISAGLSLPQAIAVLARQGPDALRQAFARFPWLARSLGVVPALEVIRDDVADPTTDRIIEVLILSYEQGGQIVTQILRDLADATAKDVKALEENRSNQLEQRINARAVFVIPWGLLVILVLTPGSFRDFYRTSGGVVTVIIGACLSLLGMWWVSKLGKEPDERRVFGHAGQASS